MNILIQSKSDSTRQMIRSAKLAWQPCMKTVTFLSQRMDREPSESAADRGRATVVSYRSLAGEWGTAALVSWWSMTGRARRKAATAMATAHGRTCRSAVIIIT